MQDEKAILRRAEEIIDARAAEMAAFSDWLAEHPELSGEEYESSRLMAEKLRGEGFEVEYPFCGIPTAFMAKKSFGAKKPAVAIMAEYDALPASATAAGTTCTARCRSTRGSRSARLWPARGSAASCAS